MNELRRDYFTDRWVVIATERSKRPTDFVRPKPAEAPPQQPCAFCPGNEHLTPPSKASYFLDSGALKHEADVQGQPPRTGWLIRTIPNLYPAVKPEEARIASERLMTASGVHEVIVETPEHNRQPQDMSDDEIKRLFLVYRDRFRTIGKLPYVRYISLFRNYGKEAGASLAHPHSQIIAIPIVPEGIRRQYDQDYARVIEGEEKSERLVLARAHAVAFAPYASAYPYEVWVFPRRPRGNVSELTDDERDDVAVLLRDVLARLSRLLADPPYNYVFVQSMADRLHMHIRVYPKLGIEAGFELNTGVNINSVPPEAAARSLREIGA